jgi:hypothetical protein
MQCNIIISYSYKAKCEYIFLIIDLGLYFSFKDIKKLMIIYLQKKTVFLFNKVRN